MKNLVFGALLGAAVMFTLAAATSNKSTEVLRIRKLIIVDEKGAEGKQESNQAATGSASSRLSFASWRRSGVL